tara:strand:+ start:4854 stop:5774 length:921 start_codon:yes stop_codon:yes gene_type:complete
MKVAIILCVKNGEKFLKEQLVSIKNQSFTNFDLHIFYNDSNDNSLQIIKDFISSNENLSVIWYQGNDMHFANNFISGLKQLTFEYDYYSFCDQDDIWLENHLKRSIEKIGSLSAGIASVFCSRTLLIDQRGRKLGKSMYFSKDPSFKNALVQSIAGGNTMVFNKKAFDYICLADESLKIISHDWLLYLIVTASGGKVFYSQQPSVLYRQHAKNKIGSNLGFLNKLKRLKMLLKGDFNKYNIHNFDQLDKFNFITQENKKIYEQYKKSFKGSFISRFFNIISSGVYRQTAFGQIGLFLNIFIKNERN